MSFFLLFIFFIQLQQWFLANNFSVQLFFIGRIQIHIFSCKSKKRITSLISPHF